MQSTRYQAGEKKHKRLEEISKSCKTWEMFSMKPEHFKVSPTRSESSYGSYTSIWKSITPRGRYPSTL